jgi:hypothetical protein
VIAVVITIMVKPVPLEPLRSRLEVRKAVVDDHAAQAHDFSVACGERAKHEASWTLGLTPV